MQQLELIDGANSAQLMKLQRVKTALGSTRRRRAERGGAHHGAEGRGYDGKQAVAVAGVLMRDLLTFTNTLQTGLAQLMQTVAGADVREAAGEGEGGSLPRRAADIIQAMTPQVCHVTPQWCHMTRHTTYWGRISHRFTRHLAPSPPPLARGPRRRQRT